MMHGTQGRQDNPHQANISKKRKVNCSVCGKEGHKANNKLFHPDGNPNAKIGPIRTSKKSAVQPPPRHIGEIDDEGDEDEVPGLGLESDDEDDDIPVLQDGDSDMEWGEEALDWGEDDGTHTEFGIRDIFFGIRDIVPDF